MPEAAATCYLGRLSSTLSLGVARRSVLSQDLPQPGSLGRGRGQLGHHSHFCAGWQVNLGRIRSSTDPRVGRLGQLQDDVASSSAISQICIEQTGPRPAATASLRDPMRLLLRGAQSSPPLSMPAVWSQRTDPANPGQALSSFVQSLVLGCSSSDPEGPCRWHLIHTCNLQTSRRLVDEHFTQTGGGGGGESRAGKTIHTSTPAETPSFFTQEQ
ncbi:hypothetical protein Landi51_07296 [Colletotrichum acutatum]